MRVIGGQARGRQIKAPTSASVRPTSDRVREAMFDVLASLDAIEGASVVDAFAGSGALGIEALSRGAGSVTFVDTDREAVATVTSNLERVGLAARPGTRVVRAETVSYLAGRAEHYDLALLDPPYRFASWRPLLEKLRARLVVLESASAIELPERFELYRSYRYGGTLVTVVTEVDPPRSATNEHAGHGGREVP